MEGGNLCCLHELLMNLLAGSWDASDIQQYRHRSFSLTRGKTKTLLVRGRPYKIRVHRWSGNLWRPDKRQKDKKKIDTMTPSPLFFFCFLAPW